MYSHHNNREQEELEVAKAISLSNAHPKPQEGKENHRKPPAITKEHRTASTKHHSNMSPDSVESNGNAITPFPPRGQLQPPPGLGPPAPIVPELSLSDATSSRECIEWPDLTALKRHLPTVAPAPPPTTSYTGNPQPSYAPPPPGFTTYKVPSQPPGYASSTASKVIPPSKPPPASNIIQTAKVLLNNDQKYSEFRRLSGLYARGAIPVRSYYRSCANLFGGFWEDIGPKLAQTLPNPEQQQELLALFPGKPGSTVAYSQVTTAGGRERRMKPKGSWQFGSNGDRGSVRLSEEEYPSLSASAHQPDPTIPLPGWNVKVSVK